MVDKALYIDTSGARDAMRQLEIITNNLANTNTTGFRADHATLNQFKMNDKGQQTRVYSTIGKSFSDFTPGPIINTGRDLDIAVENEGFIAVQSKSGKEGYTRAGDFQVNETGQLTTRNGDLVLGDGGVINLPKAEKVSIAPDGTLSIRVTGSNELVQLTRIKLTKPSVQQLQKGTDGLFYLADGNSVKRDETVKVRPEALEGSNVNPVETLTQLIEVSRSFQFHTNLMKTFQENAAQANQILQMPR